MNNLPDLKCIIENEFFITCPLLPTDLFVSYCIDRDIQTSRNQLEQFEKLGIFYPIARIRRPKIKIKIEYIDDGRRFKELGVLQDGEEWSGDTKKEYAHFEFGKKYAESWLDAGLLWEPSSQPFQAWETFRDEKGDKQIESFYSIFQCYTLYTLIQSTRIRLGMEVEASRSREDLNRIVSKIKELAEKCISVLQENKNRREAIPRLCQIISNRYFPKTQSDRRSLSIQVSGFHYFEWDWYEYCRKWDAKAVFEDIGINTDELKRYQESVAMTAKSVDPLRNWYGLVSFVSMEKKKELKGKALLAQTLYSMEHMLRLFYEEITGEKLCPPDESPIWKKDYFYGEGITQNELQYLEYLTNQYHLNPRPRLMLVVEGDGETEQFPRLAKEFFGYSFPQLGIEIINLHGVPGFTGNRRLDKYGALEKFIDDYHYRQTIVFAVLDNEDRVSTIKEQLVKKHSKLYPKRTVTIEEYIRIWDKNIEFDNFSNEEIARAMTELCGGKYTFKAEEIADCRNRFVARDGKSLSNLYKEKLDYSLPKPKLLGILFGFIIPHPENEFDNGKAKRPVVEIMKKVIELAIMNNPPISYDIWQKNQESGYFGVLIE